MLLLHFFKLVKICLVCEYRANAEEDKASAADRTERLLLSLGDSDVDSERSKEIIEKIVDSKIEEAE